METITGLKSRRRKDGTTAYYWVASAVSKKAGNFPLKTVRVHGSMEEIEAKCRSLTSELKQWLAENGVAAPIAYDRKLRTLIKMYRTNKASGYFDVSPKTREMYDYALDTLDRECGMRMLDKVTGLDIKQWYAYLRSPAEETEKQAEKRAAAKADGIVLPPNPERPRRAYQCMQMLRIVIGFGVVSDIKDCYRLKQVLEEMRFQVPKARTETITFEQVQTICSLAIAKGMHSMALAQALQFELTLRQVDVIGMWEKNADHLDGGILDRGHARALASLCMVLASCAGEGCAGNKCGLSAFVAACVRRDALEGNSVCLEGGKKFGNNRRVDGGDVSRIWAIDPAHIVSVNTAVFLRRVHTDDITITYFEL